MQQRCISGRLCLRNSAKTLPRCQRHSQRGFRHARIACSAGREGPNGLNVEGHRPTSQKGWTQMRAALKKANVHMISPQETLFAVQRGAAAILDVRPEELFTKSHIPGACNVPFFRPIQGWEPWKIVRRIGFAAFGVLNGTEANPDFITEVLKKVSKDKAVVVYCSVGGSLDDNQAQRSLSQTRSVMAAYVLVSEGFTNVSVLKGGYQGWLQVGREVEIVEEASGPDTPLTP